MGAKTPLSFLNLKLVSYSPILLPKFHIHMGRKEGRKERRKEKPGRGREKMR
jgi:hypothetical protein